MTTIEKIKAEVERRIKRNKEEYAPDGLFEVQDNLAKLLSFLSTLESEKPVPNDLEEAADEMAIRAFPEKKSYSTVIDRVVDYNAVDRKNYRDGIIAGAKWQKGQDLAEMAQSKSPLSVAYANRCFENGKQAMKEQMMKEAVEVQVVGEQRDLRLIDSTQRCMFNAKRGDWLKIIIVKE